MLEQGVVEGRKTFLNILKYLNIATSSNFGNMFRVLGASALLPFLPMLPLHLLVQNLLYDLSQTLIPFGNVDEEELRRPRAWNAEDIGRFMVLIGPVSSIFDYATFSGSDPERGSPWPRRLRPPCFRHLGRRAGPAGHGLQPDGRDPGRVSPLEPRRGDPRQGDARVDPRRAARCRDRRRSRRRRCGGQPHGHQGLPRPRSSSRSGESSSFPSRATGSRPCRGSYEATRPEQRRWI